MQTGNGVDGRRPAEQVGEARLQLQIGFDRLLAADLQHRAHFASLGLEDREEAGLAGEPGELLDPLAPVSMNFWGFTPDYFAYSAEFFKSFLSDPKNMENLKSEFFIPLMVDKLINDGTATCEVLDTTSKWFGVTYPEDRQSVVDKIQALVDAGEYPAKLF